MEPQQLNLFANNPIDANRASRPETLSMDANALMQWKSRIFTHQQRVRESPQQQQVTLFDIAPKHCDPHQIDPLTLQLQSMSFYRMPADSPGDACLYFVIDSAASLVLYIGETCRSNKRWKGIHDCKDYIESYQSLHYQYGMKTAVNIAFWWDTPVQTRPRQQLEQALIQKWKSPFNKECWQRWGQPFG